MNVEVNYLAVLLAAVASMAVGSVWYAKSVFGEKWGKLVGIDFSKQKGSDAAKSIVVAFVASLLTAYILAHVTYLSNHFFGTSFMSSALQTAFWLWLGISATTVVTHDAFEGRPMTLTALTLGHNLVSILAMGLVIGWLHP